jgi:hypothetical protein
MAGFSDYLEKKVLDLIFSNTAYTIPTTLYLGLFTATPSDAGGGTEVSTSGTAYDRADITNNSTNFPAASGTNPTLKSNGTSIPFVQATAAWGTVGWWGIFDANTAGNLLIWGPITTPKAIDIGDTASFAIGDLDITLD